MDDEIRKALCYDPESGVLRWRETRGPTAPKDGVVGTPGAHPYGRVMIGGRHYLAHRVAWFLHYGAWPLRGIDHIDGNPGNNRINNLRDVEQMTNSQNLRCAMSNSRSGLLGAHWHKMSRRWHAQIRVGGRVRHLGAFRTADDAHAAYLGAKRLLHEGCTI